MPENSPVHEDKDYKEHSDDDGHFHVREDDDKSHSTPDSDSTTALPIPDHAEKEICFSPSTTVTLVDGTIKSMSDLASGDIVFGNYGTPKCMFGFGHDATLLSEFIALKTHSGHKFCTSPGHVAYFNDKVVAEKDVRVGVMLTLVNGHISAVNQIE